MQLSKVIVHELIKEKNEDIQDSNYREEVLNPENAAVVKLMAGILDVYGTRHNSAHYGTFLNNEGRGAFPDDFEGYKAYEEPTDEAFIALTRTAMERLYDKASSSHFATGGYIVFSDFISQGDRFFLIAMIKKTPGITLTEDLEPEELEQLELSKLHQAARINFSKLATYDDADDDERDSLSYLSFISSTSSKSASGYFVTALGCAPGTASGKATDNLLRESKRFFRENEGLKSKGEDFFNDLMDYLSEKEASGESVKLAEIGHVVVRHIPDNMADESDDLLDAYMERLNSEEVAVPAEFPVNKRSLNKHTRITAGGDSWKFSFEKNALSSTDPAADVFYDRDQESITLTRLPAGMIADILEALDEFNQDDEADE